MKRSISLLFLSFTLFLSLISCSKRKDLDEKVVNLVSIAEIKGMDPGQTSDLYSNREVARIYEGLLEYHYLKRPYTLVPNLAESMPTVSADGLVYTFKIRQGVLFQDDKAFPGGKGRELVAEDFVFSLKRLADPKYNSVGWWLIDGKIKGLNEWRDANKNAQTVDYTQLVEGLKATDRYTLQVTLGRPFPQFLYALAMPYTFAVAKEVVEHYGAEFLNHPVGTGPYLLPEFTQAKKITYVRNPKFREKLYPTEGEEGDKEKGLLDDAGKRLPLNDKIVVEVITEDQPRWLNFQKGNLDLTSLPKDNMSASMTPDKKLTDEMQKKGFNLDVNPSLDVTYIAFNHEDPLFKNVKLRRAMSLAYNETEANKLFYNDYAMVAQSVVPPGIAGHIPGFKNPYKQNNVEEAKKILAEAGYPGGKGLPELSFETTATSQSRQMGEFLVKEMAQIGIKIKISGNTWPELQNKINNKTAQMYGMAWGADYPDAENFLQLLYGPNKAPGSNGANYNNPEFNALFKEASLMQDTPIRTAAYEKLNRMVAEDVPWIFGVHRMTFTMTQSWLKNFKNIEFDAGQEKYLRVDLDKKKEMIKKL